MYPIDWALTQYWRAWTFRKPGKEAYAHLSQQLPCSLLAALTSFGNFSLLRCGISHKNGAPCRKLEPSGMKVFVLTFRNKRGTIQQGEREGDVNSVGG